MSTATEFVRVQVRVGKAWVPAHLGVVSREKGERIRRAYQIDRPASNVRIIPEGES